MALSTSRSVSAPLRANSHVLRLLGEELIGDDGLAIFELVKNGYDADATQVQVTITEGPGEPTIIVADDGFGMSLDDIRRRWLVLATPSKRGASNRTRSPKFNRLPLGEKGVGRIAAFKLGGELTVETRAAGDSECVVHVRLDDLIAQGTFLDELSVTVEERLRPVAFEGSKTGTKITIRDLYRREWKRADLRKLNRLLTSLSTPFETSDKFAVLLAVPGREKDLQGMFGADDFKDQSVWKFSFLVDEKGFSWEYEFRPPLWKSVLSRSASVFAQPLLLDQSEKDTGQEPDAVFRPELLHGIGPIRGVIYGYHQRQEVLKAIGNQTQLKAWLADQSGVRVYRDSVRVFNYGEPGDDWLGLNVRRINRPGERFGTSSIVAAVSLSLEKSFALREKTNREGFDNGGAYPRFRNLVFSAFERFEKEAADDRQRLSEALRGKGSPETPVRFVEAIETLRKGLSKQDIPRTYQSAVDAIEREYAELRDVMVSAGTAGLNLSVIFHEIEREVDALAAAVNRGLSESVLRKQIEQIHFMLHGFAPLLRKNPVRSVLCSEVVGQAARVRQSRFAFHKVVFSAPILSREEDDFQIKGAPNLLVGAIGNLLDNAIYWTKVRQELLQQERIVQERAIRVMTAHREDGSSLIAVVDNGPGFSERALAKGGTAFFSERPGGTGLGLYFASLACEQMGGVLTLSNAADLREELDVPPALDGAAVVLRFGGKL